MRIKLFEHCTIQVFAEDKNGNKDGVIVPAHVFDAITIESRKILFNKTLPYNITYDTKQNSYHLQADYYIGLDWLVQGHKFVQIEPKVNQKLLEVYESSLLKEETFGDTNTDEENNIQTLIEEETKEPDKQKSIDYLKMLLEVFTSEIPEEKIGDLVEIYWEDAKIRIEQKDDYLTPFLVVQFLNLLKKIVRKGLKKSYYKVQENLRNRNKGKILLGAQIKQNVFKNRLTSTYCEYQVFGENNAENQFLKKVFNFCTSYIQNKPRFFGNTISSINHTIGYIRPVFEQIDDSLNESKVRSFKNNPFFKEYKEAIKIGGFILKMFGFNIASTLGEEIETPPFWIDMPRLFELYFYQKLLKDNPKDKNKIIFQLTTYGNALDFLIKDGDKSIIIDTKYKLHYKQSHIHQDVRQVSGYARLKKVRKECGFEGSDAHINCLIVYPSLRNTEDSFSITAIQDKLVEKNEIKAYHKIYKLGIKLPTLH